jgi:hypothetical protein
MSANALVAGDVGAAWFAKFNANDTRLDGEASTRASADAALQAEIAALQAQMATLSTGGYTPPVGAYATPAAGGLQTYGLNSTAWHTATSTGKVTVIAPAYTSSTTPAYSGWMDSFGATTGAVLCVTQDALSAYTARYVTISAGVPSVVSSCNVPSPVAITSLNAAGDCLPRVISACPISPTSMKVVYNPGYYNGGFSAYQAAIVTFAAGALSEAGAVGSSGSTNNFMQTPCYQKRGCLVGSASVAYQSNSSAGATTGYMTGFSTIDRGSSCTWGLAFLNNNVAQPFDWVGSSLAVRAYSTTRAVDATARPTIDLLSFGDQTETITSSIRLIGYSCASVSGVYCLSSTLAVVLFKDSSGYQYVASVAVNATAGTIALIGVQNASTWGASAIAAWSPVQYESANVGATLAYSGTDLYVAVLATATGVSFAHFAFNTSTGLWSFAGVVTLALGSGIAGLTGAVVVSYAQTGTDQIAVLYYATATTSGFWLEVFALT